MKTKDNRIYTVWIGGTEATDHLLTKSEATEVVDQYKKLGYNDVQIATY